MKKAAVKVFCDDQKDKIMVVCDALRRVGIEPVLFGDGVNIDEDELLRACDFVVAPGGDGTIIHTAKQASLYNKPVLGVNFGHLGFMAGIESNELEMLGALVSGDYITERRMMLEITVDNGGEKTVLYCLNDAVLSRGAMLKLVNISILINETSTVNYRCDAVIAATPTGSTAYSLSAGGPVLDPSMKAIIITPVCAHSFYSRPLVLSPDNSITISAVDEQGDCYLTVDGSESVKLNSGAKVTVKCSNDHFASLIRIKKETFLDVLNNKMVDKK